MCGIIGYIGANCFMCLLNGLKQLQNRGYDSAGICLLNSESKFNCEKYASTRSETAISKLENTIHNLDSDTTINVGIGHTRWATHGPKTDINSHPHIDTLEKKFVLVHNGIIENFQVLKNNIISESGGSIKFKSQTDTEVIVNLLAWEYSQCNNSCVLTAIRNTINKLEGTFALCILCTDTPNKMYCVRKGSPLLLSWNSDIFYVASEQSGFCNLVNRYICLDNDDICIAEYSGGSGNKKITVRTDKNKNYSPKSISSNKYDSLTPDPYTYWTMKEIMEQTQSLDRAISYGGRIIDETTVKLGGLEMYQNILEKIDHLVLLGCGTSYHAGKIGVEYFKDLCSFNTVYLYDGAEFREKDLPRYTKNMGAILLSQSGETKDLHRCLPILENSGVFTMGVINVIDSQIAREVNCGCYTNAGREVAVASTKTFVNQCVILSMMAIWFAQINGLHRTKRQRYLKDLKQLPLQVQQVLDSREKYKQFTGKVFKNKPSCFLLGKDKLEAVAREGSLKIKELSYIHAEGYNGSSLKHGPFGLLEPEFPVVLIDGVGESHAKMNNVYEEVLSRHATVLTITDDLEMENTRENIILVPHNRTYQEILCVIPLQFLAYYLALDKGLNPDFPRNLAKVVTVE